MNTVTLTSNNATQYQNNYNNSVKKENEVLNKYEDINGHTRELGDVSFEIERDENLDPYSVSYEDYKGLNYTALETIFGKDTQELSDAAGLMTLTSITNDDILNKLYNHSKSNPIFTTSDKLFEDFDKYKEYFYTNVEEGWSGNFDIKKIFNAMDEIKSLYQTRVEEKEALLEQLTKNNKPNPIESLT